ncbi:branched-chain amino acid aminotransferase/4-amino-4-deoxychorismate lyase [Opitutaceae bacterium TAV1]|nr:aminotransferase class IV [Opitutaceae bacterium TAV5]EIP97675.1 branched-chain amino acid aminotransferase/4-amino-4-deoxychorismate lyase [Opitutaceae bacterium TAV1]
MSTPFIQANTNGRLHRADEPSISPLNRGFLYGDAVYEVWRTYHGVIFAWEEHWQRLERSAAALHLTLPFSAAAILGELRKTASAFRAASREQGDLYLRLQVTRGAGPIGLDTALADRTDFVILVQPVPKLSSSQLETGLKLSLATGLRRNPPDALDPAWKTGNYLNNILCLREARARGADEVVITNQRGEITEAAVCNIAFVRGGELLTPPLEAGILAGITRGLLFSGIAAQAGVGIREEVIRPADLAGMDECCLLSTTKDLQPVGAIDGHRYRTGADTVTRRVKAAFAAHARGVADRRRPELAA